MSTDLRQLVVEATPTNHNQEGCWSTGSATDAVADVGGLRRVDHPNDLQLDARRQRSVDLPTTRRSRISRRTGPRPARTAGRAPPQRYPTRAAGRSRRHRGLSGSSFGPAMYPSRGIDM